MQIDVSVIVAVYNSEKYLRECIESVLNQTLKSIELILVIDGSPDNSFIICEEYKLLDERVKVLYQENQGPGNAFRNGQLISNGKYLMYLDGDDWIDLNTCKTAFDEAKKNDADIVFWPFIKEFGIHSKPEKTIFKEYQIFKGSELDSLKLRVVGLIGKELRYPTRTDAISSMWGKLYRSEMILTNDISSLDKFGRLNFDVFFNIKAFYYSKRVIYIPFFYSHYRQYNINSVTKNWGIKLFERYKSLFKAISEFIREKELQKEYSIALNNRIAMSTINLALTLSSSRNRVALKEKYCQIKNILNSDVYRNSFDKLKFEYLPIYWKFFFLMAKYRIVFGIYFLGKVLLKLR